ncbi:MAG: Cys-tRNA(Pro) deacylase [Ilumatobacteraceae bacterium]
MAKKGSGAGTPALVQLERAGIPHQVHHFEHQAGIQHFGLEAAEALGVDPARVFKTLVATSDRGFAVAIVAADRQVQMKALAAALGAKRCELAAVPDAERITGYVRGGVSPFGQKKLLPTVIDEQAFSHDTIFVSGGRRGLDIELAPQALLDALGAIRADVAAERGPSGSGGRGSVA